MIKIHFHHHVLTNTLISLPLFLNAVAIVFYSILAIEFLTRVVLKKPVHSRAPKASSSTGFESPDQVEERKDEIAQDVQEAVETDHNLRRKIKLLVIGLGFSTLCLFIR